MSSLKVEHSLPTRTYGEQSQMLREGSLPSSSFCKNFLSFFGGFSHSSGPKSLPTQTVSGSSSNSSSSQSRLPKRAPHPLSIQPHSQGLPQHEPPKPTLTRQPQSWEQNITASSRNTTSQSQSGPRPLIFSKPCDTNRGSAKHVIGPGHKTTITPAVPAYGNRDNTPRSAAFQSPDPTTQLIVPKGSQYSSTNSKSYGTRRLAVTTRGRTGSFNPKALAVIRESLEVSNGEEKEALSGLNPPPLSPILYESSQKFHKTHDDESTSLSNPKLKHNLKPSLIDTLSFPHTSSISNKPGAHQRLSRDGVPHVASPLLSVNPTISRNLSLDSLTGGECGAKATEAAEIYQGLSISAEDEGYNRIGAVCRQGGTAEPPNRVALTQTRASEAMSLSSHMADMTKPTQAAFKHHLGPIVPSRPKVNQADSGEQPPEKRPWANDRLSPVLEPASGLNYSSYNEKSPSEQLNLRSNSLAVSKWLTFGHIFFSDLHHKLSADHTDPKCHSVLVIDDLGYKDWSLYAAQTYPKVAFFYLTPGIPLAEVSPTGPLKSPANHHQVAYVSQQENFPFDPQSFTAVIYRFPKAASSSHYIHILAQSRRVLKPGGYLEMSILDVDLNDMGSYGYQAVRQLKEQIFETAPETNLASTADLMVHQVRENGFSDIRALRIRIPVARSIVRAHGDSKVREAKSFAEQSQKENYQSDLSDTMSHPNSKVDTRTAKMVGPVSCWWHARCYGSASSLNVTTGIWSDKALLKECERMGTSFNLMLCCGRAPDCSANN